MKKIISVLISLSLILSYSAVFADTAVSADMEKILISVKKKIDVSEALTEFSGSMNTYDNNTTYDFYWSSEDGKSLSVTSDSSGRIMHYYSYENNNGEAKISPYSKDDVISIAEAFVKKTIPEAYADNVGCLVVDESTYRINQNLRFSLDFVRQNNGVSVKDNYVNVSGNITDDGPIIYSLNTSLDYDTEFAPATDAIADNYIEKYRNAFPPELIYYDDYTYAKTSTDEETQPLLIYRLKDFNGGYISAANGDVVVEDGYDYDLYKAESAVDATANLAGGAMPVELNEEEIKELGVVEGLISVAKAEKILKSLPYIKFDKALELSSTQLDKYQDNEYYYGLYYSAKNMYLSALINAHSGKVIRLSSGNYSINDTNEKALLEKEKSAAEKKINEFLSAVTEDELNSVDEGTADYTSNTISKAYTRIVNGIKYVNNGIYVSFDAKNNCITHYRLDFTEKEFAPPENIITANDAYDAINEKAPVEKIYIKSNNKYVLCYGIKDSYLLVDAFSGEVVNENENISQFSYTDISGHWAQEAISKLGEVQIGLKGEKFNPDSAITQEDLLRLFSAGIQYSYYLNLQTDELYRELINMKILSEAEKAPDALVKREDAFVYMIRLSGFEKVAKLQDIYKIDFADGHLISEGKLGYAAILSGMGVICGDGGYLRPSSQITRAEAASMLYRFMLTF